MSRDEAAVLRELELTVLRRLDGMLHGDYQGLLPGHGSELAEARSYVPGDDVRRIDWNVTARTTEPHVRDTIVDRELTTVALVDLSASLAFGTGRCEKRDLALAAVAAVGLLAARGGNRVGALLLADGDADWVPPRSGRRHLFHVMRRIQTAPRDGGAVDLGAGMRTMRRLATRRGLVLVVSDFLAPAGWHRQLRPLAHRHDVTAVEIVDPRELELPDVGLLMVVDPETGRRRHVDTARRRVRERYAAAAADQRSEIGRLIRWAGADHLQLRTDRDWVLDLVAHVATRRRRRAAAMRAAP